MPFRLTTLGGLSLHDGVANRPLAIPRKALAILSVLASSRNNASVPREKILGLLWPDAGDSGRGALKQTMYELRQAVGTRDIITGTTALSLDRSLITSDLEDLERACAAGDWLRAADLYTGPFLDGFALRGAVEFEHWADSQRAYFYARYVDALEHAATDASRAGDTRAAIALWRRLAAAEPLNAHIAAQVIRTLAASGDPAGALAHFRVHAELLNEEIGAQPDPSLLALVEQLRTPAVSSRAGENPRAAQSPLDETATSVGAEPRAAVRSGLNPPGEQKPPVGTGGRGLKLALLASLLVVLGLAAGVVEWRGRASARSLVLESVPLPRETASVAIDAQGFRLYASGPADFKSALTIVDTHTLRSRTVPYGAGILVDPITDWYWSGDYRGHAVIVRNGHTDAEIGRIEVPGCPHFFDFDGQWVLAAEQCDDHISVIDGRTRKLLRNIPIPTLSRVDVGGAKGMGDIFANPNTGIAYFDKDNVPERLDPHNWQIRETPDFGGVVLGVNRLMNRIYVRMDHGVRVIDGTSEKVVAETRLPGTPRWVVVGIGGRRVFVAVHGALVVLNGIDDEVQSTVAFSDGFDPWSVAIDGGRNRAYVLGGSPDGSRSLKVVDLED